VCSAFTAKGDFSQRSGTWKLTGEIAGGGKVEIALADETSSGLFPQGPAKIDASQDLDQQLGPAGSGGLLAALHLWRQMLIEGPQKFGEVYYYGTMPYPGIEGQADVIIATRNVAELHFIFDSADGRLAAMEMIADSADDGCELRFSDYRDVSGRLVPHRIEARHGYDLFGNMEWKTIELGSAVKEAKP